MSRLKWVAKFSILPSNSEIIDNDGWRVDTSGSTTTSSRLGYFASWEVGALDVPGYFLSAKLFATGSTNWALWFPENSRIYNVWVHVPKNASATSVRYKVYPKGRPVDGSCSTSNATNPCYETNAINHSTNQDKWVRLTAGSITQFSFVASNTNGAYVGLEGKSVVGGKAGVDAVKFVYAKKAILNLSYSSASSSNLCNGITPCWSYTAYLGEKAGVGVSITKFKSVFYDSNGNYINTQFNTTTDFINWFNDCGYGSSYIPPLSRVCGNLWTHLGGRSSGSVVMTFDGKDNNGNSVSISKRQYLNSSSAKSSSVQEQKAQPFSIPKAGPQQ